MPFAIESALGLSALTLRVAGSAVDGLFHVTAVGLISIVQIAVSGFRKCFKIGCYRMRCRTSRKRSGLIPRFGGLVCKWNQKVRGCAQLRRIMSFVFKFIRFFL